MGHNKVAHNKTLETQTTGTKQNYLMFYHYYCFMLQILKNFYSTIYIYIYSQNSQHKILFNLFSFFLWPKNNTFLFYVLFDSNVVFNVVCISLKVCTKSGAHLLVQYIVYVFIIFVLLIGRFRFRFRIMN